MQVVEIFKSIDGEGKRVGLPTTFIRLHGCNLECSYCDTRYGCVGDDHETMEVKEIVEVCKQLGVSSVTITGGEPLIHPNIEELINELLREGFWVNVETNGSVDVGVFCTKILNGGQSIGERRVIARKLFFTVDYKCPSSGMEDRMIVKMYHNLRSVDVIKFVVGNVEDMDVARQLLEQTRPEAEVYFSPVFGSIEPREIVEYILDHNLNKCKMQIQLHKVIWAPELRGV